MTDNVVSRVLGWLRAGYPQGIPRGDYIALFGVLRRSLTEGEVDQVATELYRGHGGLDSSIPEDRIKDQIRRVVHETPLDEDVRRVAARLALGGWPLVGGDELKKA